MDIKVLELATQLTDKAMGSPQAATSWINSPDKIQEFLKATAQTLNELYRESP